MEREHEILEELKMLGSPLAGLSTAVPFAVPDGYFNGLSRQLLDGVTASESEDADLHLPKSLPYSIPQNYFEDSAAHILARAALSDAEPSFEVPDGYFDALPDKIMTAIQGEEKPVQKSRVIAFRPARRALQWAMAAMLVLGIGLGGYKFYYTADRKAQNQLAKVDGDAITDYVSQNIDAAPDAVAMNTPAASAVQTLSKDDIAAYLDETGWEDAPTAD